MPVIESENFKYIPANEIDTTAYKLILNYEDPFLKQEPKQKNINYSNKILSQKTQKATTSIKAEVPAKDIRFVGVVQNKTTGITMAMISVNGTSHLIKKGDIVEGIKVQNILQDVIEVKDGKQTIKISR